MSAKRMIGRVLVAFLCLMGAVQASQAQAIIMGAVGSAGANIWPFYIAIKNGYFTEAGITPDIIFVQSNAGVNLQLAAGSIDVAITTGLVDPIRAIEKGASAAIIRIAISPAPYAIVGKASIASIADLKGKRITIGGAKDITRILTDGVLSANQVDPSTVEYSYAGSTAARLTALQSGVVDAAILLPPYNFYAETAGFRSLALTKEFVPDLPFAGTVVNTKWAERNPDLVRKLLAIDDKSIVWFNNTANREKAIDIMVEVSKGNRADVEKTYDYKQRNEFFEKTSAISRRKLERVVRALTETGDIEAGLSVEKLVLPKTQFTE